MLCSCVVLLVLYILISLHFIILTTIIAMNKKFQKLFSAAFAALGLTMLSACSDKVDGLDTTVNNDVYVSQDEAIEIAKRFINSTGPEGAITRAASGGELKVVMTDIKPGTRAEGEAHPSYYVINLDSTAFVVVSGSKVTYPVLGYSYTTPFITTDIPDGAQTMLNDLASEVKYANKHVQPSAATENMREVSLAQIGRAHV